MKSKFVYMTVVLLAIGLFATNAFAAWSFGISTDYSAGDSQAVFNLNLSTDEAISLGQYTMEFIFDNNELSFDSYTNTPVTGLTAELFGAFSSDQTAGTLNLFSAAGFAPANVAAGDYLLGTFTFNVTGEVADGITDFNFNSDSLLLGYEINNVWLTETLSHNTDIAPAAAAVPVPSAFWLFGSGIAGIACFRRRRA